MTDGQSVTDSGCWLDSLCEQGFRVTFARRLAPRELLTRMGADPLAFRRRDPAAAEQAQGRLEWGRSVARAGLHEGWAYAVESVGVPDARVGALRRVARGTRALTLLRTGGGWGFALAEDGEVVATEASVVAEGPGGPLGDWPWRSGLVGGAPEARGEVAARLLALAEGALAARLPRDQVEWGWLVSAEVGEAVARQAALPDRAFRPLGGVP
ncbi:hypothetical protein [Streptomyces zhaozhouensis]|uniref:hypothetical protein n=1 Tax=Streptomyces zhaozhouensis TaxID=1300267 RepID=UPI001142ABC5|nr:hypothetical protein [Streptomyces zhaozhouensis]